MQPSPFPLEPFTEGDLWEGIPNLKILFNGARYGSPLQDISMRFKKAGAVPSAVVELSYSQGGISITSGVNWEFSVNAQEMPDLTHGTWTWRMRFTAEDGTIATLLSDEIEVLEDVRVAAGPIAVG